VVFLHFRVLHGHWPQLRFALRSNVDWIQANQAAGLGLSHP
jgi:hypothetical protein